MGDMYLFKESGLPDLERPTSVMKKRQLARRGGQQAALNRQARHQEDMEM